MEQIAILATSLGNRIETVLYAALLMGYIAFNLYRRSACRRQLTWQAAWLFCSMVLAILSGSINQLLYYQQQNTSTALEIFLWCNKVVPRLLWFPVLSAMGEFDLRWPDDILMTCYAAVMALTPRKSNLACLIWCVPFLWAMLRMKDHRDSRSHWLTLCLLVCAVLHLCNAAANISGFEDLGTLLRKTLGILGYPAVFTLDLYGRMAEARNSTPPPGGGGGYPCFRPACAPGRLPG